MILKYLLLVLLFVKVSDGNDFSPDARATHPKHGHNRFSGISFHIPGFR